MEVLNCLKPDFEPKVTDNIQEIIDFVKKLIEKKHAYIIDNDVYFDIESFKEYADKFYFIRKKHIEQFN